MEQEIIATGYCRALDQSRMVTLEVLEGRTEADCAWPDCPYAPRCPIAQKFQTAVNKTRT